MIHMKTFSFLHFHYFVPLLLFAMFLLALPAYSQKKFVTRHDTSLVIKFVTPSIVRVQWAADVLPIDNNTGICVYPEIKVPVEVSSNGSSTVYRSADLCVEVNNKTSALTFFDAQTGELLLKEDSFTPREYEPVVQERIVYDDTSQRIEDTANGKVTVKDIIRRDTIGISTLYRNHFAFCTDEALYGFGSHMEDYMNLNGKTLYLVQHNLKATVPVLLSTKGYGLLFDAGCAMKFENGTIELEAAKSLDYYFMKGETFDKTIAQYRYLTGKVTLLPRYAFGYIQSKERYTSSSDIINTLAEYRRRHVPIDMIVQDWNYWPMGWGYMKMNRKYYPDPKALADSVHAMNARLMVSIWPIRKTARRKRILEARDLCSNILFTMRLTLMHADVIGNMPTMSSSATASMRGGPTAPNR